MYGIRDDSVSSLLYVELSGRLPTAEVARAVSQAFALVEAGQRSRLVCDLRGVSSGPDEPGVVAALIAARNSPALRIAFVGNAEQLRHARQLARLSGITGQAGAFSRVADAEAWLARKAAESEGSRAGGKPESQALGWPRTEVQSPVLARRGSAA